MRELLGKVLAITDVTAHWHEFQTRCLFDYTSAGNWNAKRELDGAMGDLSDGTVGRQSVHGGDRVNVTLARIDENRPCSGVRERGQGQRLISRAGWGEKRWEKI
jgi:hypothetical protein